MNFLTQFFNSKKSRPISASQLDFLSSANFPKSSSQHSKSNSKLLPPIDSPTPASHNNNPLVRSFDSSVPSYIIKNNEVDAASSVVSRPTVLRRHFTSSSDLFNNSASAHIGEHLLPVTENKKKLPVKLKSVNTQLSIDRSSAINDSSSNNLNILVTDLPAAIEILNQFSRQVSESRPFSGSIYSSSVCIYLIKGSV
jgi:hypothetical protein